jgi:hypothetical protein
MRRRPFSDSYASSEDTVYPPGFLRFDAGVYARITETWKARLDIENIFDKGCIGGTVRPSVGAFRRPYAARTLSTLSAASCPLR